MTVKTTKFVLYLIVILFLMIYFGCSPQPYNKRYFILNANRPGEAVAASEDKNLVLEIKRFTIDRAFDSKSVIYRMGEYEYESDFYNEFLISPAEMITEKTRIWLSDSGLFAQVPGRSGSVTPTHTLEGNIIALYGDYKDRSRPLAVIEIRIFLIADVREEKTLIFGNTYSVSVEVVSGRIDGLIEAFDSGLEQILSQLESDLAGAI